MKHFFYAVYVLFYSGAVLMAGVFVGQYLERKRIRQAKEAELDSAAVHGHSRSEIVNGERKVTAMTRRQA